MKGYKNDNKSELTIRRIKSVLNEYYSITKGESAFKFKKALPRLIGSKIAKYYLNHSGIDVVGELGRFYTEDNYTIGSVTTTIKRYVRKDGSISWKNTDHDDKSKYRVIRYEYNDKRKIAIIEYDEEVRNFSHKVGDVYPGTNQLFMKIPIIRVKSDEGYDLINGSNIKIKNIKSRITLDELTAWMGCDVDNQSGESPFYELDISNNYTDEFIDLCRFLNDRLNFNIDLSSYD